jgi:hypothetical protein
MICSVLATLCFECVNHPEGRRFERVPCLLHELAGHTVAPLQHRRKAVATLCLNSAGFYVIGCSHHDQLADLHRAAAVHYFPFICIFHALHADPPSPVLFRPPDPAVSTPTRPTARVPDTPRRAWRRCMLRHARGGVSGMLECRATTSPCCNAAGTRTAS